MPNTADLSRVIALEHKGRELMLKGHFARAAEKFRLAAEEAEKALPDPDCLVICALRVLQLEAMLCHATASAAIPADADEVLRDIYLRLMPSAMAVVERRRAAGTLLPGSCRPAEESYQMTMKRRELELEGKTQASASTCAASLAPYLGVETFARVAKSVVFMLYNMKTLTLGHTVVLSDEQKHAAYLFLASAVDLMTRPRNLDSWVSGEPELVRYLRALIPKVSDMDDPETKKLCAAWQRLLSSGVLRERGIDKGIDQTHQLNARLRAAAEADLAAGRLQQCGLAGCAACESHVSQFKRCGACRTVSYCCREHQVEDWPSHKAACKAARTAAESAA